MCTTKITNHQNIKKVFTFSYDAYKCGQLRLQWLKFPLETQTCRNIGVTNDISQKLSWIKKHRESHKLTHTCSMNGLYKEKDIA